MESLCFLFEDQFRFRSGKSMKEAIVVLGIKVKKLHMDTICSVDYKKLFGRVKKIDKCTEEVSG